MTDKPKATKEFRMSAYEFNRIMGKALQVKSVESTKAKKPKPRKKKARARKPTKSGA